MEEIILDKSYLDGATSQEINRLCKEYRVLMPDVLFYELTTTTETSRHRCFNKFPATSNPVELIPNVGTLLRYELNNLKPCTPLYDRREKIVFNFHSGLASGKFAFTMAQRQAVKEQEAYIVQETQEFLELAMMISTFFPDIRGASHGAFPEKIQGAKDQVSSDKSTVRRIYAGLLKENNIATPVHPDLLEPDWAYFSWMQVRCLYSLDLIFRYNGRIPATGKTRFWNSIEHDMLDCEYVILASLCGGLACSEKRMVDFF
ncbi:MAG: hypothetical protein ACLFUL_09695, partial [Desulfobacteraceae bacterium]